MNSNVVMVRYGELSTKGKNIKDFIKKLANNIKDSLKEFTELTYKVQHDHIYINLNGVEFEKVSEKLKLIPGISSFSLVTSIAPDLDEIIKVGTEIAQKSSAKTFKVITKRADKLFPYHSDDINRKVAASVLQNTDLKVDVHNPELEIRITVRENEAFVYQESIPGLGGYPLGIAGKALMLISGGIDSPVASFLMMKRGVKLEMIHFAAPPYTSEQVLVKIKDIIHKLNVFQPAVKLYIVPFTEIQKKIYEVAGTSYAITIMRRMMLRIAERVARYNRDLVLASGESIGQVASQTLTSMASIEECCGLPLIRPLATYDKVDIIKLSKNIDTYDISIRPYEDCCTIFEVRDPTTSPKLDKIREIEAKFDFSQLLDEAYMNIEKVYVKPEEDEF